MAEFNYRHSAIYKISKTAKVLEELTTKFPKDSTLKIFETQILQRMRYMGNVLNSWYRDGIKEEWNARTISEGKVACMGNIDSLELLVGDIKHELIQQIDTAENCH